MVQALEVLDFPAVLLDVFDRVVYVNARFGREFCCERYGVLGGPAEAIAPLAECLAQLGGAMSCGKRIVTLPGSAEGVRDYSAFSARLGLRLSSAMRPEPIRMVVICPVREEAERDAAVLSIGWRELLNSVRMFRPLGDGNALIGDRPSMREWQIRVLDDMGCDTKRIAHVLSITPSTVRVIRSRGLRKSPVSSLPAIAEAV